MHPQIHRMVAEKAAELTLFGVQGNLMKTGRRALS